MEGSADDMPLKRFTFSHLRSVRKNDKFYCISFFSCRIFYDSNIDKMNYKLTHTHTHTHTKRERERQRQSRLFVIDDISYIRTSCID